MAKLVSYKANKNYHCSCGKEIIKGETYHKVYAMKGGNFSVTTKCDQCKPKRWELTVSQYFAWLWKLEDTHQDLDATTFQVVLEEELKLLNQKFENMPRGLKAGKSGDILQTRINGIKIALDSFIEQPKNDESNLQNLKYDIVSTLPK